MKTNGISYAERKRISLKIERNNSIFCNHIEIKLEATNQNKALLLLY